MDLLDLCEEIENSCQLVHARLLYRNEERSDECFGLEVVPKVRNPNYFPFPLYLHSILLIVRDNLLELYQLRFGRDLLQTLHLNLDTTSVLQVCQWINQLMEQPRGENFRMCQGVSQSQLQKNFYFDSIRESEMKLLVRYAL